ncbi:PIN domain-containing protein [Synechococcus sp. CS-1325]|uniref:PIN domain-containing protein n=1 Tax=unclassified Synechococcus TaxID=2626047 RepID=UPI000DB47D2A|nr:MULTISPECIES: PIN domain-containing protein [unclassified Synechococcus]MCT0198614.1 PIN domain-containing protein [Synechococcus sp. CS-1325]MCT0212786.1 PIN domain-containing protein [Synechococcus sp. CS-1326]MCT0232618.1 PIN domain-containing protein [Synechococcus sp. CS-1327]PZV02133.1 MAG: VapC toxin family PIN domain ribonuclease [Cyanobium sp.]
MAASWLLDTSALLALRDDEDGAERVAQLLQAAQSGQAVCFVCFMSRMEVLYRVWKDEGERHARLADAQVQSLPIHWVPCSDALLELASAIKACHPLSVADAWIAAAAQQQDAVLVHKDPEFRPLAQIAQEWLGCP